MKHYYYLLSFLLLCACSVTPAEQSDKPPKIDKEQVTIQTFPMECNIRAIIAADENTLWFGGSNGQFGYTEDGGEHWHIDSIRHTDQPDLEFRGIAKTPNAVFLLAIGSPALLFKTEDQGENWSVVYREDHPDAFYDAIAFWNDKAGIAMGDPTEDCLSIILTTDGGDSWTKIPCEDLPPAADKEAAFAASNSNIALVGNHAWIVSGGGSARVFHSPDRGASWEVFDTPIVQGGKMTGIFTADFYDAKRGIIFGGDWEDQSQNSKNKALTADGGKTWTLIADGQEPGYRSSVQYLPDSDAQGILAAGIPGISYSADGGQRWAALSDSSFYTIRVCDSGKAAWLGGARKIGRMSW